MRSGKKQTVEKVVMKTCQELKLKTRKKFLYTFFSLLLKVRPLLGLVSKRFGKQFKKIPVPLYPRRQTILALK
jgi:ribosomal protein S7